MLFDIKKKEQKIFGFELSDGTRAVIKMLSEGSKTPVSEAMEVVSICKEFDQIPDDELEKDLEKYMKIIRRRYIIRNIADIGFTCGTIAYTSYLCYNLGVTSGVKAALSSDAYNNVRDNAKEELLDELETKALEDGQAAVKHNLNDGSERWLVCHVENEKPECYNEDTPKQYI
jgi:hypothetical protein